MRPYARLRHLHSPVSVLWGRRSTPMRMRALGVPELRRVWDVLRRLRRLGGLWRLHRSPYASSTGLRVRRLYLLSALLPVFLYNAAAPLGGHLKTGHQWTGQVSRAPN